MKKTINASGANIKNDVLMQKQKDFLQEFLNGLDGLDSASARGVVKQPQLIKPYLSLRKGCGLPCFYLLHIILLTLDLTFDKAMVDKGRSEILNEMSDEDIAVLKECIVIAKSKNKYDVAEATKLVENKKRAKDPFMLVSAKITLAVAELWDDAVRALNAWDNATMNFVRVIKPKEIVAPIAQTSETVVVPVKRGPGRPKKITSSDAAAKVLLQPGTKIASLVDIASFENYLVILEVLCGEAKQKVEAAEAEYNNIEKALRKEKDSSKRGKLISDLTKSNNVLMKAQANFDGCSDDYKKAKSLLDERQNKLAALMETDAKIVELLKNINSKVK